MRASSVERLPIPLCADREGDECKERDLPELQGYFRGSISLEEDAADDAQEMGEREYLANDLRPLRHPTEGKHETREKKRGEKEEERHLHGLKLILGNGRESDSHGEIRRDKRERHEEQQRETADHGHLE